MNRVKVEVVALVGYMTWKSALVDLLSLLSNASSDDM